MNERPVIVIIQDDEDDSFLLEHALRKSGVENPIEIAGDMAQAFARLDSRKKSNVPFFVIINLGMFLATGAAIVRWIREEDGLRDMPILAVGNSDRETDIQKAYDLGANAYFAKRIDTNELAGLIRELQFLNPLLSRTERS